LLKKSITFEDFNGQTVTEDHYFHLSKSDLVELEVSHQGGLQAWITRIVETEDAKALIDEFKKLILWSYGKKSGDGRRFIKTAALREEFESSPAYEELFMELVTNSDAAAEFVNNIIPKRLEEDMKKMAGSTNAKDEAERVRQLSDEDVGKAASEMDSNVFETSSTKVLTREELLEMDSEELKSGLATGKYILPQ
jgi:hypothetical protein